MELYCIVRIGTPVIEGLHLYKGDEGMETYSKNWDPCSTQGDSICIKVVGEWKRRSECGIFLAATNFTTLTEYIYAQQKVSAVPTGNIMRPISYED
jgi:hypothetical protein